jgi:hypothetical protein
MITTAESALRILIRRRNLHGDLRHVTRELIHRSIAQIQVVRRGAVDEHR